MELDGTVESTAASAEVDEVVEIVVVAGIAVAVAVAVVVVVAVAWEYQKIVVGQGEQIDHLACPSLMRMDHPRCLLNHLVAGIAAVRPRAASVASHPCGWCLVVYATNPIEVMLLGIADARSHAASVA